jgi:hypothetical protein
VFRSRLHRAGLFASGPSRSGTRSPRGPTVALPLAQLTADPDEVEEAVQQGIAGQAFLSKSSEQELMQ